MAPTFRTDRAAPRAIEPVTSEDVNARRAGLWAAGLTAAAALCGLAAIASNTVRSATEESPGPGVPAAAAVSLAPLVAVALLALAAALSRPALAGALTAGYGAVALGLTVLDVGLLRSPIDANRLELFRPNTAEVLDPAAGAYLFIASHVFAVVGGLFGLRAIDRASFGENYGHSAQAELVGRAAAIRIGGTLSALAAAAALLTAGAMFAPAYVSTDSIVLVPAVVQSALTTSIGSGLIALAVLVVVAAALASISPTVTSGAIAGAGLAVLGVFATRVIAGSASGPEIEVSAGSWLGTVAASVLVLVGALALPSAMRRDLRVAAVRERRRASLPSGRSIHLHIAAGIDGAVAGVLLCAGALLPVLDVPAGLPDPTILAARVALVAGFVLVLACVPMFFSLFAAATRPLLGVVAVAGVMAGAGVLHAVLMATEIDGIAVGSGGVATGLGVIAAVVCGALVLLAGSAEREDVDTSEIRTDSKIGSVALLGGTMSAIGLGLPLYSGVDASAASFVDFPWGWDAWGQAVLAVTVVAATAVSARSRPARSTALLVGCVVAMIVYLLGWPLTQGRVSDPVVGAGAVVGVIGVVVLAVAALLSARRAQK